MRRIIRSCIFGSEGVAILTKKADKTITWLFAVFLAVFFALNLFTPDRDFSPKENRFLQTAPELSASSLFSGEYTRKAETWFSDQFIWRDMWISLKARAELLLGKSSNNGVFLCQDQRLLEAFDAPDSSVLSSRISSVNAFCGKIGVPVVFALIPSAGEIYADMLPEGACADSQTQTIRTLYSQADCDTADLTASLAAHRGEYIYYYTDHHWTSLGAYYGYCALSDALGYTAAKIESYHPRVVSESFLGTEYSSSGFFWVRPDSMSTYAEDPEDLVIERFDGAQAAAGALYNDEMLETKDKYRFFLGGNTPRIVIHTGHEELPSLLIIRDSFADSLVPFLLEHFSEIHLIDLRYFYESAADYAAENRIDSVLILYSVDNFCTDSNISLLIR